MIKFTARLTSEQTREVSWGVDEDEFAEWAGNRKPTSALLREFIQAGRDREEIEDSMWANGRPVDTTSHPFVEITKISDITTLDTPAETRP